MNKKVSLFKLSLSMCIFGTIGIFRRLIPFSSGLIAFARGVIGVLFLFTFLLIIRQKVDLRAVRRYLWPLIISGIALGSNWVMLFEAYNYTAISTATVCNYMAPICASAAAVWIFKDKITLQKGICFLISCTGLILVSGVLVDGLSGLTGILLALGAAVLYASVMLLNRMMTDINAYDRTIVQLAASSVAIGIYTFLTDDFSAYTFDWRSVLLLAVVGIVHTGIAYMLYFGVMNQLPTQTVSLFSYLDPVLSILLSALILHESMTVPVLIGMVMVLGGTIFSEITFKRRGTEKESS